MRFVKKGYMFMDSTLEIPSTNQFENGQFERFCPHCTSGKQFKKTAIIGAHPHISLICSTTQPSSHLKVQYGLIIMFKVPYGAFLCLKLHMLSFEVLCWNKSYALRAGSKWGVSVVKDFYVGSFQRYSSLQGVLRNPL